MNYVSKAFLWNMASKVFENVIKVVAVPLLLTKYGRGNFALIALTLSINSYINLIDYGLNSGSIKFFSQWIEKREFNKLQNAFSANTTFYLLIGFTNCLVIFLISNNFLSVFSVNQSQQIALKNLLFITAGFTIVNWYLLLLNQLLVSLEQIHFMQSINLIKSILYGVLIFYIVKNEVDFSTYFVLFNILNVLVIAPYIYRINKLKVISSWTIGFNFTELKTILKYSIAILSVGIFQISANNLRPLILSIYSKDGITVVTDYRILETITTFIISLGSILSTIYLPKASRIVANSCTKELEEFVVDSTKYTAVIVCFLCCPFIVSSKEILEIYVGKEFLSLTNWLCLWIFIILMYLHSTPINSVILATGKTKPLVYSTAFACIMSLATNIYLCNIYRVGSSIIGFGVYIFIQMFVYYVYYNRNVLNLNSKIIFMAFLKPTLIAVISVFLIKLLAINFLPIYAALIIKVLIWIVVFLTLILLFKVLSIKDLPLNSQHSLSKIKIFQK